MPNFSITTNSTHTKVTPTTSSAESSSANNQNNFATSISNTSNQATTFTPGRAIIDAAKSMKELHELQALHTNLQEKLKITFDFSPAGHEIPPNHPNIIVQRNQTDPYQFRVYTPGEKEITYADDLPGLTAAITQAVDTQQLSKLKNLQRELHNIFDILPASQEADLDSCKFHVRLTQTHPRTISLARPGSKNWREIASLEILKNTLANPQITEALENYQLDKLKDLRKELNNAFDIGFPPGQASFSIAQPTILVRPSQSRPGEFSIFIPGQRGFIYVSKIADLRNTISRAVETQQIQQASAQKNLSTIDAAKHATNTIQKITQSLSPETRSFFKRILELPSVGVTTPDAPIVSGDTDGSTGRAILLGIQTGRLSITDEGITRLQNMLEREAEAANTPGYMSILKFHEFQGDKVLQNDLIEIEKTLTYHQGFRPLIFIGDVAHDRLSCNKDIDFVIREKLHANGAIFIFGNHDAFACTKLIDPTQAGTNAHSTISPEDWDRHEQKVFVNAYFDDKTRTLYIHNGLSFLNTQPTAFSQNSLTDKKTNTIKTAFGEINIDSQKKDIQELVQQINKMNHGRGNKENTNFRPHPELIHSVAQAYNIRIVHGHDGSFNIEKFNDVLSINARENGKFSAAAIILGSSDK